MSHAPQPTLHGWRHGHTLLVSAAIAIIGTILTRTMLPRGDWVTDFLSFVCLGIAVVCTCAGICSLAADDATARTMFERDRFEERYHYGLHQNERRRRGEPWTPMYADAPSPTLVMGWTSDDRPLPKS
ncbi:hypothetical protein HYV74_03920 [Candidatus Uhrbacteria bacterium]|nr:hypothetical protein [Candidatus Uhrbacteria bacterium]